MINDVINFCYLCQIVNVPCAEVVVAGFGVAFLAGEVCGARVGRRALQPIAKWQAGASFRNRPRAAGHSSAGAFGPEVIRQN